MFSFCDESIKYKCFSLKYWYSHSFLLIGRKTLWYCSKQKWDLCRLMLLYSSHLIKFSTEVIFLMVPNQFSFQLTNLCLHPLATLLLARLGTFSLGWQKYSFAIWLPFQMNSLPFLYICNLHWSSLSYLKSPVMPGSWFLSNLLSSVLEVPSPPRPCKTCSTWLCILLETSQHVPYPMTELINLLSVHQYLEAFVMAHIKWSCRWCVFISLIEPRSGKRPKFQKCVLLSFLLSILPDS